MMAPCFLRRMWSAGQRWALPRVVPAGGSGDYPSTVMPMERAVPAMIFSAASMVVAVRSGIFVWAISRTWAAVIEPTFSLCGSPLPFSTPAAFLISSGAGGVLVMNVNERSSKMVISTGITFPRWASVAALYCRQKSMMFTPCGPSAVPTGGAGVACPAGSCTLTTAAILFLGGIVYLSDLRYLIEGELDRRLPAEDRHQHLELLRVGVDLADRRRERGKRAVHHGNRLADGELDDRPLLFLLLRLLFRLGREELRDLIKLE